jgi:hypothetical protein
MIAKAMPYRLVTVLSTLLALALAPSAGAAKKKVRFRVTQVNIWDDGLIGEFQSIFRGAPIDVDHDGDLDYLIMVSEPPSEDGGTNRPEPALLLRSDNGEWVEASRKHLRKIRAANPIQVLVADFNGDGRSDVYVASSGTDHHPFPGEPNLLALAAGRAKLTAKNGGFPSNPSTFTNSAAMADVDGDGDIDIFEGHMPFGVDQTEPRLLFNDGQGRFSTRQGTLPNIFRIPGEELYDSENFFDADQDGDPDLLLLQNGFHDSFLLDNKDGIFEIVPGALPQHGGFVTLEAAIGDLNGDGWPDIFVAFLLKDFSVMEDNPVLSAVYLNQGDGTFQETPRSWMPKAYREGLEVFVLADLNNDGFPDLIARKFPVGTRVFLNSKGKKFKLLRKPFTESHTFLSSNCCAGVRGAADQDGDGDIDLFFLDGLRFLYAENLTIDK